jgi:hypothetical protein
MTRKALPRDATPLPGAMRDTVMISHANPEDNEFTLWLVLQLARDGYKVWSDLTDLVGGEQFWTDIEHVIRNRAVKFIYVLSRTSNESNRGFRKELDLADSEARRIVREHPRFVVPVAIDDLPSRDYNIFVHQLNCVQAREWSSGLREILKRLRKDRVPRFRNKFNAGKINSWWQRFRSAKAGIKRKPDTYLSNWFPMVRLPDNIYWYRLEKIGENAPLLDFDLPFRFVQRGEFVLTCAEEAVVSRSLGDVAQIASRESLSVKSLVDQKFPTVAGSETNPKFLLLELLRGSWESWIENRGLGIYQLANRRLCAFFRPEEGQDALRVSFPGVDGQQTWRSLIGTFTKRSAASPQMTTKHYWHFGIQARPRLWPQPVFHISSHVLFSDNGKTIWDNKRRLHSARRRQCKSWYNDEWRDRLLGAMALLADGKEQLEIPVSESETIQIAIRPIAFESKITCEPLAKLASEDEDIELVDDEDDEESDTTGEGEVAF